MPDLPLTGHCLCGAVRFEVTEPFVSAGYCHCTRCQRRTGTAAAPSGRVPRRAVRIVSGEDQLGAYTPEDGFPKVFCTACGSAILAGDLGADGDAIVAIRFGALDDDPGIRPQYHQWVSSAAPWEPLPDDGLPRYEGARPG